MQKLIGLALCAIGVYIFADENEKIDEKEKKNLTEEFGTNIVDSNIIPKPDNEPEQNQMEEIKNESVS